MKKNPKGIITGVAIIAVLFAVLLIAPAVSPANKIAKIADSKNSDEVHVYYMMAKDPQATEVSALKRPGPGPVLCYSLTGHKWATLPVSYVINPTNTQGLSESLVTSAIYAAAETWDAATSKELFNNNYQINYNLQTVPYVQDSVNSIVFGDFGNVTTILGMAYVYGGKGKQSSYIKEFDIILNQKDWAWGDTSGNPSVWDLQGMATHELGHVIGLYDIDNVNCSSVTMYHDVGHTTPQQSFDKRSLAPADITGLQKIYGP
jgi:hypothetical protein